MNISFDRILDKIQNGPAVIGPFVKNELQIIFDGIRSHWEELQKTPLSVEGVRHIRPKRYDFLRVIEINGSDIYVYRKGNNEEKFSEGGMKEVSLGIHLNTLKPVVQGTIRYADIYDLSSDEIKELVTREIELQRKLMDLDKVVQIEHTCTYLSKDGTQKIGITMEFCYGDLFESLWDIEDNKRQVFTLIEDMLVILKMLKDRGVIHRDIKSENLFLKEEKGIFRLKVGDFGNAGMIRADKKKLKKGVVIGGTPEFSAPEVYTFVRGEKLPASEEEINLLCSSKIDVWSMGMVLFELLFKCPTDELTLMELKDYIQLENVCFKSLDEETCEKLFIILRGMLVEDPSKRLSVDELLNHLYEIAS